MVNPFGDPNHERPRSKKHLDDERPPTNVPKPYELMRPPPPVAGGIFFRSRPRMIRVHMLRFLLSRQYRCRHGRSIRRLADRSGCLVRLG